MMKSISLHLNDRTYSDTEKIIAETKADQDRYVNEALDYYNALKRREMISTQLKKESALVREDSMKVLAEFENFTNDADSSI